MASVSKVYIVAAKRTPFGAFGGALKNISANLLGAVAARAALDTLPKEVSVDTVVFGNVAQTSNDAAYLARHVALRSGVPIAVPALTVNRLCGSGFEAAVQGCMEIQLGRARVALVGGSESMSLSPHALRGVRWGTRYGVDLPLEDTLAAALVDRFPRPPVPMGITAETLATERQITRADCDAYALSSHQRWAAAQDAGRFANEIAPVPNSFDEKGKKKASDAHLLSTDEHPRRDVSLEKMAKLRPSFRENGTTTPGNASGICDGAAALVLASEDAVREHSLQPLARIVSYASVGVDPSRMGIGPVPACNAALKLAKLNLAQVDLIEINEAFAAQYLAVERDLGLDRARTNTNGGAIAIGHPLAASGARILGHLCYELQRTKKRTALGAACIGGGQGIAVVLERE